MPTHPGPDLRKVTLNLFEEDCEWMEMQMGRGWSQWIRTTINAEVHRLKNMKSERKRKFLGDLPE